MLAARPMSATAYRPGARDGDADEQHDPGNEADQGSAADPPLVARTAAVVDEQSKRGAGAGEREHGPEPDFLRNQVDAWQVDAWDGGGHEATSSRHGQKATDWPDAM